MNAPMPSTRSAWGDAAWHVWPRPAILAKRAIDVIGAALALLALAPVIALIALAVRAQSRGPSLFRQPRVGRGGRVFAMWKFRTMVIDAEAQRTALLARSRETGWLALEHDPRITSVGRLLRRMSLDEVPQLWNVLRGDMSLVGPRPLVPAEDEHVPVWARARRDVAPGMTGLWQVSGRTAIPFIEMLWLDHVYVTTWSLRKDIAILARTLPAVLTGKGAN